MGWTPAIVEDLDVDEIQWYAERLKQKRSEEARAIKQAIESPKKKR